MTLNLNQLAVAVFGALVSTAMLVAASAPHVPLA